MVPPKTARRRITPASCDLRRGCRAHTGILFWSQCPTSVLHWVQWLAGSTKTKDEKLVSPSAFFLILLALTPPSHFASSLVNKELQ